MLQKLLAHPIRKQLLKKNKPLNHRALLQSLTLADRVPFLARYHKKKLIAFGLLIVISYTYDLHRMLWRKILGMRSPVRWMQSWFVEERKIPGTILEQNYKGVDLESNTITLLMDLYACADKELYFGVGRYYLFQVYQELGAIGTEEQVKKFWLGSGFYKERNQKASGVGLVEFLTIFQQAFKHLSKKNQQLTQEQFLNKFTLKFIQKAPQVQKWQAEFNRQRTKQFLKNMPGDNQKKKDAIIQIIRQTTQKSPQLLSQHEIQQKIKEMGLKGLNLTDRMLYWELRRTWDVLRVASLDRRIGHPLTVEAEKMGLRREKEKIMEGVVECEGKMKEIEQKFQGLYNEKIF